MRRCRQSGPSWSKPRPKPPSLPSVLSAITGSARTRPVAADTIAVLPANRKPTGKDGRLGAGSFDPHTEHDMLLLLFLIYPTSARSFTHRRCSTSVHLGRERTVHDGRESLVHSRARIDTQPEPAGH